jgi:hypothetical protein
MAELELNAQQTREALQHYLGKHLNVPPDTVGIEFNTDYMYDFTGITVTYPPTLGLSDVETSTNSTLAVKEDNGPPVFSPEEEQDAIQQARTWAWLITHHPDINWIPENPTTVGFWCSILSRSLGSLRAHDTGWLIHPYDKGEPCICATLPEAVALMRTWNTSLSS